MKKKLIILGILAALVITGGIISGAWDTASLYEIVEEDGEHYLLMDREWEYTGVGRLEPSWSSAKRGKKAIMNGKLQLDQIIYLRKLLADPNDYENEKLRILDPELICDLKLPKGYRCREWIWCGDAYLYSLSGVQKDYVRVDLQLPSDEEFLEKKKEEFFKSTLKELKSWTDNETGGRIRLMNRAYGCNLFIQKEYNIEGKHGIMFLKETYRLTESEPLTILRDQTPDIEFFGISNGVQYSGKISDIDPVALNQLPSALELVPID